jgi:glutamate-1-semialdehyde 2,1-aminomutase
VRVVSDVVATYAARTPGSRAIWERARAVMPGGDTRTCVFFRPHPVALARGEGAYLWDVDGNRYVDLNCNGMSIIHGHAFAPVRTALIEASARGSAWAGPHESQVRLGELLQARSPGFERVRFCSSGTEAGMLAAKAVRRATGRPLLLKAAHGYHGGFDDLEAGLHGSGELSGRTLLAPYGDAAAFERILAARGAEIAAVVLEPVGVTGVIPPPDDFLSRLREATRAVGALLVLDECITFRSDVGGYQRIAGVEADVTMLGKFLGGGLPLGAIAGLADVMEVFDPTAASTLYHSGSFNGNVLSTATACVTLEHLDAAGIARMDAQAAELEAALAATAAELDVPLTLTRSGSMIGPHFSNEAPTMDKSEEDEDALALLHLAALNHGVFFNPNDGVIVMSTAVTDDVLEQAKQGLCAALTSISSQLVRQEA